MFLPNKYVLWEEYRVWFVTTFKCLTYLDATWTLQFMRLNKIVIAGSWFRLTINYLSLVSSVLGFHIWGLGKGILFRFVSIQLSSGRTDCCGLGGRGLVCFLFFLINVGLCIFRTRLQIWSKILKACVFSAFWWFVSAPLWGLDPGGWEGLSSLQTCLLSSLSSQPRGLFPFFWL